MCTCAVREPEQWEEVLTKSSVPAELRVGRRPQDDGCTGEHQCEHTAIYWTPMRTPRVNDPPCVWSLYMTILGLTCISVQMETVKTTHYTLIVSTLVDCNLTVESPSKHLMQQAVGDLLRYFQVTIGERKEKEFFCSNFHYQYCI